MQEPAVNLKSVLRSKDEGPLCRPMQWTTTAPDVPQTPQKLWNNPNLLASIQCLAQEEARCMRFLKMEKFFFKIIKDVLYYALKAGYEEMNASLKKASFFFCGNCYSRK